MTKKIVITCCTILIAFVSLICFMPSKEAQAEEQTTFNYVAKPSNTRAYISPSSWVGFYNLEISYSYDTLTGIYNFNDIMFTIRTSTNNYETTHGWNPDWSLQIGAMPNAYYVGIHFDIGNLFRFYLGIFDENGSPITTTSGTYYDLNSNTSLKTALSTYGSRSPMIQTMWQTSFLYPRVNATYNQGYAEGKQAGITEGYNNGYDIGYDTGLNHGYQNGYSVGLIDGDEQGFIEGYNEGVRQNQDDFYNEGYDEGLAEGKEMGYTNGYNDGEYDGYQQGLATADNDFQALFMGVANAPLTILASVLSFDLFGISAYQVLFGVMTLLLAIWLIKKFMI